MRRHRARRPPPWVQTKRLHGIEQLESRTMLATNVLKLDFALDTSLVPTTHGASVGSDFGAANIRDGSGRNHIGEVIYNSGQSPTYVVNSFPVVPNPLPTGWDGHAISFDGDSYVRYDDTILGFSGSFSAFARIRHVAGDGGDIMGSSTDGNGGWNVRIAANGRLEVDFQGGLNNVFAGNGPVVGNGQWVDIGLTFEGAPGDFTSDTLRVYINGSLYATFQGNASYLRRPFGQAFAIGGDTFGQAPLPILYDRVELWTGVLNSSEMAALSAPAPPTEGSTTLDFDGADEPFYTTPNVGATLSLKQLNAIFDGGGIGLRVGSAKESTWQLRDTAGNHYLQGSTAASAADFVGNFARGTGATRIAVNLGPFSGPTAVVLTAYAERVTNVTKGALDSLTVVGSSEIIIDGSSQTMANFDLDLEELAGSFSIEVITGSQTARINSIGWDSTAYDPPFKPIFAGTDTGEWHKFRGNKQQTGRSESVGNISDPELLWSQFIGSRQSWVALTPSAASGDLALPTTNISFNSSQLPAWEIGGPHYDLDGTGVLTSIPNSQYTKIGDFLPASPGLEKIETTLIADGAEGYISFYKRQGGAWVHQWNSQVMPNVYFSPNPIVGDFDNDGSLEVAVTPWYDVWVFSLATGAFEAKASFNPPSASSGRPYGWFGAEDLNNDGKSEFVVLSDFEDKIGVVGYNASGVLQTLWTRQVETSFDTTHLIGVKPLQDIDGDGREEIVTTIYDESGDDRWHVMAFNAMTGAVKLNLIDRVLIGTSDLDLDGVSELLTIDTSASSGLNIPTAGTVRVSSFEGGALSQLWTMTGVGLETTELSKHPINVNSLLSTGYTMLLASPISSTDAHPVFWTKDVVNAATGEVELTAWRMNASSQIVSIGSVSGPNARVLRSRIPPSGEAALLIQTDVPGDVPATLNHAGFSAVSVFSQRVGPLVTSPVVGRLNGVGKPTVILSAAGEMLLALHTNTATGEVETYWTRPGRGEYTGTYQTVGQSGMGSVSLADVMGDGTLATIAATRGPEGQARLVAIGPAGGELWAQDFDQFPGNPPPWNTGGLTVWSIGRFRSVSHDDVLVSLRRTTSTTEVFYLVDGQSGDIVWTRTWGDTTGNRGANGGQMAIYDWNGDGFEEALNTWIDQFYVVDGTGTNLIDKTFIYGIFPGEWPLGVEPIVDDFLSNGTATVFLYSGANMVGLMDANGNPIWKKNGTFSAFSPSIGDFNNDGTMSLFLDGRSYNAETGALEWFVPLPGTPTTSGVSADLDGDGRDEAIVAVQNTLYAIGTNAAGTAGSIKWSQTFSGTLGMPIVADSDGDGWVEVIVVSSDGYIHSVGQPTLSGDTNFDGLVDIFDVGVTSDHWETHGPAGDANRDGFVDIFDVGTISDNWDAVLPAAAFGELESPEPVPVPLLSEPARMQAVSSTIAPRLSGQSRASSNVQSPRLLWSLQRAVPSASSATTSGLVSRSLNATAVDASLLSLLAETSLERTLSALEGPTASKRASHRQPIGNPLLDDAAHLQRAIDDASPGFGDDSSDDTSEPVSADVKLASRIERRLVRRRG